MKLYLNKTIKKKIKVFAVPSKQLIVIESPIS